jgi:hypothetical protein
LALTDAFAVIVNVHVLCLFPPVEHAPDQIASRPLDTLSVICVPDANADTPVVPTGTLMPDGLEVMREPLRPDALTDSVIVVPGGGGADCGVKLRTGCEPGMTPVVRTMKSLTVSIERLIATSLTETSGWA